MEEVLSRSPWTPGTRVSEVLQGDKEDQMGASAKIYADGKCNRQRCAPYKRVTKIIGAAHG